MTDPSGREKTRLKKEVVSSQDTCVRGDPT